jgi:hypothetical protein
MEESLIIEIWDTFRQYIPEKNKETAANQFVDFLVGKDVDIGTLEALQGFDVYLDDAINLVVEEHKSLDGEEDDIDYGEDEEY